uniref:Uncharacterized protein n=1 Tax=Rhizophora mucronata TaxID=61149 RepID=A0A2P2Q948_RHIMU
MADLAHMGQYQAGYSWNQQLQLEGKVKPQPNHVGQFNYGLVNRQFWLQFQF